MTLYLPSTWQFGEILCCLPFTFWTGWFGKFCHHLSRLCRAEMSSHEAEVGDIGSEKTLGPWNEHCESWLWLNRLNRLFGKLTQSGFCFKPWSRCDPQVGFGDSLLLFWGPVVARGNIVKALLFQAPTNDGLLFRWFENRKLWDGPSGTGRVPLSKFYGKSITDAEWRFGESESYLRAFLAAIVVLMDLRTVGAWEFRSPCWFLWRRVCLAHDLGELGALDETSTRLGKQVIIPNYIQGASNCTMAFWWFAFRRTEQNDWNNQFEKRGWVAALR